MIVKHSCNYKPSAAKLLQEPDVSDEVQNKENALPRPGAQAVSGRVAAQKVHSALVIGGTAVDLFSFDILSARSHYIFASCMLCGCQH